MTFKIDWSRLFKPWPHWHSCYTTRSRMFEETFGFGIFTFTRMIPEDTCRL